MKSLLVRNEEWKYVKANEPHPEDANWENNDEKALATVNLGIMPAQLGHIENCETSHEAWEKLKEVFEPQGPATRIMLTKKLLTARMEEGEKMANFLKEFFESDVSKFSITPCLMSY